MNHRDELLDNIRRNTKKRFEYPHWEIQATTYADKIKQFCEISRQVGGDAMVWQEGDCLDDIIRSRFPEAHSIASILPEVTCSTLNPDDVACAQDLNGIDLAVISGEMGVAENGAVWIPQTVKHKLLYFIAVALLIVLDRNKLVNNMHEAYATLKTETYPYGVFISGPSKTADIEQALVMGAHGARKVLVVLR